MGDFPRKADGRRIFTPEFKRETVQRILGGEKTIAELTRELDISPTVIRNWKRRYETGAATAVRADEDGCSASVPAARRTQAITTASLWALFISLLSRGEDPLDRSRG